MKCETCQKTRCREALKNDGPCNIPQTTKAYNDFCHGSCSSPEIIVTENKTERCNRCLGRGGWEVIERGMYLFKPCFKCSHLDALRGMKGMK